MEFLEGENLASRIEKTGPMAPGQACLIAAEILSAIEAAHQAGIVHRDLKPQNVFLVRQSRGETVKILDFGISRMVAGDEPDRRLTHTGLVMGTPYYMAPEQAAGESEITAAADVYAIGVILYEMLTGKVPFEATNYNTLIYKVLSGDFAPPRAHAPQLPPQLEHIICTAMSLKPPMRFASAAQFAQAIAPFVPAMSPSGQIPLDWVSGPSGSQPALAPVMAPPTPSPYPLSGSGEFALGPTLADTGERGRAARTTSAPTLADRPSQPGRSGSRAWVWAIVGVIALGGVGALLFFAIERGKAATAGDSAPVEAAEAAEAAEPAEVAPAAAAEPADGAEVARVEEPPDDPAAAAPATVTVRFVVKPADAELWVAGERIEGLAIERAASEEEVEVEVRRDGYEAKARSVRFDVNQQVEVILEPVPDRARPGKKPAREPSGSKPKRDRIITDSPYQ
jgi:eukaryotic-like serine/threonine-protein kinase